MSTHNMATDTLGTIGEVAARHVAESNNEAVKEFGRKAKTTLTDAAEYFEDTDADEMVSDAAHYAGKYAVPLAIAAGFIVVAAVTTYFVRRS